MESVHGGVMNWFMRGVGGQVEGLGFRDEGVFGSGTFDIYVSWGYFVTVCRSLYLTFKTSGLDSFIRFNRFVCFT